jgi:dienelactone hydrolase
MLLGENDDYAAPEPCRQYAASIRRAGGDVTVVTYAGARHGFDGNDAQIREYRLANAQNFSNCLVNIEDDGRFVYARTGEVLHTREKYFAVLEKECITRGATVATNPSAKRQSLDDILDFLKRTVLDSQSRQ